MSDTRSSKTQSAGSKPPPAPSTRNLDSELMAFRTAWLRMVARIWADMELHRKDQKPENNELLRSLEADPIKAMKDVLGFSWPWQETLSLTVSRAKDPSKRLRWIGDDWVWDAKEAEVLTLRVPLRPKYKDPEKGLVRLQEHPNFGALQALALADYYEVRPSIFGTTGGGGGMTPRGRSLVTSASLDIADAPLLSISDYLLTASPIRFGGKGTPHGGFIASAATFLNLEVALVSGLAKAWGNETFADLLDAESEAAVINGAAGAIGALAQVRGYTPEWRLELQVVNDKIQVEKDGKKVDIEAYWVPPSQDNKVSYWHLPNKSNLKLNFPEKPEDIRDISVALAAYNSTGAEFPFTCCA